MSLRTKIFLAIVGFMLLTTTILTLSLVLHALQQYDSYEKSFQQAVRQVVENWVSTALPETLTEHDLDERLDRYRRKFEEGGGLFEEIVLVDRYRRVYRVVGEGDELKAGDLLYDEPLVEVLRDGNTVIDGRTVYRPLSREVHYQSSDTTREEILWVLRLTLRLDLPRPMAPGDLMEPVLWVMSLGTVALLLSLFYLLSRLVLKPIEQLAGVSQSIAHGDYTKRLQPPETADEIGDLVHAFNRMMAEVRDNRATLQQRVDESVKEARRAEQRLMIAQRLAATGTLAAGIAHEINNPVQGMQNASRRLQKRLDEHLDRKGREYFEIIDEALAHVQGIVKQVLEFSKGKVNPEPFDMKDPVASAAGFVRHKADRYDVDIRVQPPELDVPMCFGDRGEINQVVINLLVNAMDAIEAARDKDRLDDRTPREGVVSVTWQETADGVRTSVEDNGCGMTEEQASSAFDPFFTTKQEGTGLGLAIIHNIIDSHGGRIEITSEVGKGTAVSFTLPPHST